MVDPDRVVAAGERMQRLGKDIGLAILSIAVALIMLMIVAGLLYSLIA